MLLFAAADAEAIASRTFLCMAIIVIVGRIIGKIFARLGQPAVLGEIVAGICLGPSVLGNNLAADIFPLEVRPYLRIIAELGLVIFMFVVGLEVDLAAIRRSGRTAAVISLTSIAFPFVLGAAVLGTVLYDDHKVVEGETVKHLSFALFIGVSMCATAFAILARILAERRMFRIPLGSLLIACAAIDDVSAFSILAVVLAIAASSSAATVPVQIGGLVLFVAALALVIRPLLARYFVPRYKKEGRLTPDLLAILFIGLLTSVYTTHEMGLATLLGAFLFGAAMPREGTASMFHELVERVEGVSVTLLLPVFFVVTGLGVNLRGLGASDIGPALLILAIACIGKFAGAAIAAKVCGVSTRQSLAIGVMMNTRGLAELVILQIGRDAGVLDQKMYTMLVVMAVLTTLMAGPVLKLVYPDRWLDRDIAEADRLALGDATDRSLVVVNHASASERTLAIARALISPANGEMLLTHLPRAGGSTELGSGMLADLGAVAEAVQALESARRGLETDGFRSVVTSRPSTDPAREIVEQATATGARVLVLDAGLPDDVIEAVLAARPNDIAVVDGPPIGDRPGPVVVELDNGPDGDVALEVAARLARRDGRAVELIAGPDTRASALDRAVDALRGVGVTATVRRGELREATADGAAALVLPRARRAVAGIGSTVALVLVAGIDRDRPPLAQRVAEPALATAKGNPS